MPRSPGPATRHYLGDGNRRSHLRGGIRPSIGVLAAAGVLALLSPSLGSASALDHSPRPGAAVPDSPQPAAADLQERQQRFHPLWSPRGVVASQDRLASEVGAETLRAGGNAVDAAVATAFALAVTLPQAGNLGGGGFLVLWLPGASPAASRRCPLERDPELRLGGGTAVAVNFREKAPLAARPDLFLRPDGTVDRQRATRSLLSTGVPGTVAGLTLAQRCYGRLPLRSVLAPAIALARGGFRVSRVLSDSLAAAAPLLQADPTSRRQFFVTSAPTSAVPDTAPPSPLAPGELLVQPDLADTLRRIASEGERGFYRGPAAENLVALMLQRGGLIRHDDLQSYRAQLVRPLTSEFRGATVLTQPPPSSGVTLLQLLKLLEPLDLEASGLNGAATIHPMVEAMNLAYRDRNALLGDPDQVDVPLDRLLDPARLAAQRRSIDRRRHRPAAELTAEPALGREGTNTTHLSVADAQGGMVALTTTLNFAYGNGVSVPGSGYLLNNEMDDFTALAGAANAFGLRQGTANAIAPGRRPLSSMSPTLVFRANGQPWLATGTPGGSRIITTILQVLLNRLVFGLNLAGAVASPRLHSQLWPDQISLEQGFSPDTRRLLERLGHRLEAAAAMGSANSVEVVPQAAGGGSLGVADPRRAEGAAVAE
ncbi:gamma-glutamyltransferase [Synechococcus sp. CS-1328]|uniref:gamma-glutamyltransferase n=1 Tax=Synechococcus sp. CS-1328 TaxID=2847976 RepID=UPI00223C3A05|nr:gamma-glutamyltransferase [Synechococcus sp. CS-1328]MCT0225299.1 gamma-glutamyltransferase [Synechococcus sp. CS-1328]